MSGDRPYIYTYGFRMYKHMRTYASISGYVYHIWITMSEHMRTYLDMFIHTEHTEIYETKNPAQR